MANSGSTMLGILAHQQSPCLHAALSLGWSIDFCWVGKQGKHGIFTTPPKKKRHRVKGNDFLWFPAVVLEILVSQNLQRFCWKEPAFQPLKAMVTWAVSTVSTFSRDELGKVDPRSIWDAYDVSRCLKMYLRCLRCSLIKATCIGPIEQILQISYQGFIVS